MTERMSVVQNRIGTVRQLGAVVNAMRGIAVARAQQSRALLPAVRLYAETSLHAIRQARTLPGSASPPTQTGDSRPATILFGAEQGFAGAYPDQMIAAVTDGAEIGDLFLVGQRAVALAEQHGLASLWRTPLSHRADALTGLATIITEALYTHLAQAGPVPVRLIHATWKRADGLRIIRRSLLPLDAQDGQVALHAAPLTNLPPIELLDRFAQEYVFATLCEAACEAFAAENELRAATMATAKTHIDGKLTALQAEERRTRQEETTAEVIELASGARRILAETRHSGGHEASPPRALP